MQGPHHALHRFLKERRCLLAERVRARTIPVPDLAKRKMKARVEKNAAIVGDAARQLRDVRSRGCQGGRGSTTCQKYSLTWRQFVPTLSKT